MIKKISEYYERNTVEYFLEVQSTIEKNINDALRDDSKSLVINQVPIFAAQLEVWDANHLMENYTDHIRTFISHSNEVVSFLNLIEIGKNRSVILFRDMASLEFMRQHFPNFEYDGEKKIAITSNVILRKELFGKMYNKA